MTCGQYFRANQLRRQGKNQCLNTGQVRITQAALMPLWFQATLSTFAGLNLALDIGGDQRIQTLRSSFLSPRRAVQKAVFSTSQRIPLSIMTSLINFQKSSAVLASGSSPLAKRCSNQMPTE